MEDKGSMLGVTSNHDMVHYSLAKQGQDIQIVKLTPISNHKTNVTTISSTAVNRNRDLVYTGTSYGAPSLSSFSKAEDTQVVIHNFEENYGCMKSL